MSLGSPFGDTFNDECGVVFSFAACSNQTGSRKRRKSELLRPPYSMEIDFQWVGRTIFKVVRGIQLFNPEALDFRIVIQSSGPD
jgi:hypothetical protein